MISKCPSSEIPYVIGQTYDDNTTQDYLGEVKKAIQKTFVEWEFWRWQI